MESPEALDRFKREARAASALNRSAHLHRVRHPVSTTGSPSSCWSGCRAEPSSTRSMAKPLPIGQVVSLCEQIADALDVAHRAGIVHRDLKPPHLFVTDRGEAKILDFGLA